MVGVRARSSALDREPRRSGAGLIDARAKRKRQGAVARDAGARWEQEIKQHHARAEASGLVVFSWHIGPKFTFVRKKKGQIQPVAVGVASADFIGALRDGRYFLAEAKTVASGQRLSRHSDLKPHQRRDLERAARGGGLA
ncbi:MAG TPA: hypothetical protein VJ891_02970, partial [Casimicrobiaceae bacterium]|nr:hypothetical protein [Casimicrobiaceae bacterium]